MNPAIPLLDKYPREFKTGIQIKTCTQMFLVAKDRQPKCLSTDE
jgi:hypothetical protein